MSDGRVTGGEERSRQLFEEAQTLIPGGVNSPVRAYGAVGGTPRFMARGRGAYVWDVDGNRYVDYVMSWGPLLHGHAFPPVVLAIESGAAYGTSFGAPTEAEVDLAREVVAAVPAIEMVRFVNSGTEATMSALRLARAVTGRDLVVKFAGNYHGHADMLLAAAGSGGLTFGIPTSPGVPVAAAAGTVVASYNDQEELTRLFDAHGERIAALIVEPVAGNMGVVPPRQGFLETCRAVTRDTGSILIFDEVITGFRVARGGAQERFDIAPDLTTLGKIVGGGLPVGAFGGSVDLMRHLAPAGKVYQAGTLSGNPLAMAAGLASVTPLRDNERYSRLDVLTQRLAGGLRGAFGGSNVPVVVNAVTGMLTVFFTDRDQVRSLADAESADTARYARFFHGMQDLGYSLPPSQFEAWMVSFAHSEDLIDRTVEAAATVAERL